MIVEVVTRNAGDTEGHIDDLIAFLLKARAKGATHYKMTWSHDHDWAFKWFETYRIKTDEEVKQERIKQLEDELRSLKH